MCFSVSQLYIHYNGKFGTLRHITTPSVIVQFAHFFSLRSHAAVKQRSSVIANRCYSPWEIIYFIMASDDSVEPSNIIISEIKYVLKASIEKCYIK